MAVNRLLPKNQPDVECKKGQNKKLTYFIIFGCPVLSLIVLCLHNYYSYLIYSDFHKLPLKSNKFLDEDGSDFLHYSLQAIFKNSGEPAVQIKDEGLSRLRHSPHPNVEGTLLEKEKSDNKATIKDEGTSGLLSKKATGNGLPALKHLPFEIISSKGHHPGKGGGLDLDYDFGPLNKKKLIPAGSAQASRVNVKKEPDGQDYDYEYVYYYYDVDEDEDPENDKGDVPATRILSSSRGRYNEAEKFAAGARRQESRGKQDIQDTREKSDVDVRNKDEEPRSRQDAQVQETRGRQDAIATESRGRQDALVPESRGRQDAYVPESRGRQDAVHESSGRQDAHVPEYRRQEIPEPRVPERAIHRDNDEDNRNEGRHRGQESAGRRRGDTRNDDERPVNRYTNIERGRGGGDAVATLIVPESNEILPSRGQRTRGRQMEAVEDESLPANTRFPSRVRNSQNDQTTLPPQTKVPSHTRNLDEETSAKGSSMKLGKPHLPKDQSCTSSPNMKFDCYPENSTVTKKDCESRGCCFSVQRSQTKEPICFYPLGYKSYNISSIVNNDGKINATMKAMFQSPYPETCSTMQLIAFPYSEKNIVVMIGDSNVLPTDLEPKIVENPLYKISVAVNSTGFQIIRKSNNRIIFDSTTVGAILCAKQFFQISTTLPSKYIYGLGGPEADFPLNTDWSTRTLFTHDTVPSKNKNGYTFLPHYLCLEEDGKAHSVMFSTTSAIDFVLQPGALTYRGLMPMLSLFFTVGESAIDTLSSQSDLFAPSLPPYWALGFHLCRFGYKSLHDVMSIWSDMKNSGIPYDTQWLDIDYMKDRNDFTIGDNFKELPMFTKQLHNQHMQLVLMTDPGVSASEPKGKYPPYDRGMELDIFIKDPKGSKPLIGKVWNKKATVFPDFTHPKAQIYWGEMFEALYKKVPFDGIWLDMNEPSNFVNGSISGCANDSYDNPPYVPKVDGGFLNYLTVCMSAKHYNNVPHYYIHNLYGNTESILTAKVLQKIQKKRPFIISRSVSLPGPKYVGHWTGDIFSTWEDMAQSVKDILTFSIYNIPMVGADICGFNGNTTVDLCRRWSQLGAFYPFSRNHNSDDTIAQDPVSLGIVGSTKKALLLRYSLLPYLYTLFWEAAQFKLPVVRPSVFMFPDIKKTYNISSQFFLGDSLLVVPVLADGFTYVKAYVGNYEWYDIETNLKLGSTADTIVLPAPFDKIPVLVLGGRILPMQEPGTTTYQTRKNPMFLKVALNKDQQAVGNIYIDDGESIEPVFFTTIGWYASPGKLESRVEYSDYKTDVVLNRIEIFSLKHVTNVTLEGKPCNFQFNTTTEVLVVQLDIPIVKNFTVMWM